MTVPSNCEEVGEQGSLYLQSRCHPAVPTWTVLTGDTLTIECSKCKMVVARFRVTAEQGE